MAKIKATVLNAVVDGKQKGEVIEIDERSATQLEAIGYVRINKATETKPVEKESSASKKVGNKTPSKKRTTTKQQSEAN